MSRSKTILHFNIAGSSQNSINKLADAEKAVVKRVNQLIEQYCEGTKFCDPEFGPTDNDEFGTKSLYRDGKPPQSSGSNAYPEPQRLQWVRPKYSYGNENANDDDEDNEFDDGFDDEFGDDEFGDNFSDEEEDLCSEGKLFQEGHSCQDVIQGKLGDCWFLGALAVLATQPLFLENIFFSGDPNSNINQRWLDCGLWVCRFKKNFEYYYVIIDDRIPVYSNSKSKAPVFARCRDENELWVPLIEKAFAKLNGSYDSLIGGYIDCALRDLTGLCSQLLVLQPGHTGYNEDTGHLVENGELFKLIQKRTENGTLCGCSIQPKGGQTCQTEANIGEGLKMKHAYSIIGVCEIKVGKNMQKLIMLRNPWGNGEWSGEWSDDSEMKEKYIDQIKEAFMNRKIARNTGLTAASVAGGVDETSNDVEDLFDNKNDGIFLMSFEDWLKYYTHLFFCINFPDEYRGWRVSGEWRNDNSGGNPSCTTWSINPQYKFSLTEPTNNVVIQLTQEDLRETYGRTVVSHNNVIGFHIVPANFNFSDRKARPPQIIPGTSDVLQPTYTFHDASTLSINMAAGDYILVPSTYERGKLGKFFLSIYVNNKYASLEEAEVIAEEEEVEFDEDDENDKSTKPIQETFTFNKRRYEEAKDHLLEVCKQRNINITNILNSLSNISQDDLNRPMKIREFREKLASYGIKAMDLTDDQLRPLSGEDGIFELSDILDIFKSEKEIQDINKLQKDVSKDVDDLEYASIVTDGEIGITIKQIRDLPLDSNVSKQKVQPEDFITWTRNEKFRKLIKNYNYSETFLFSFYQKLLYVVRSIESDNPIETFIDNFPVLADQQFGITSTEEELSELIQQIKNEFVPFGVIVTSMEIYIFLTGLMKYKWNTVLELITLMFNTSSNFDDNSGDNTPHENAEDSELMSPQTPSAQQDQVNSKVDVNAKKIHSNSSFAEFENLRCGGLHKLHKFASGNNNVIYCIHCDTLLEDKYYACKGKKCNNYFCENCYKDIPNGLCDTCYASEQNRINLMHKKLHQIKKSTKKSFVVQTYKKEEIEKKFEENEKAKTWMNGTVFSLFQDSWRILKTRKIISEHNPYDRLNKEILPNKYPIYQRLRNVRRIQEYQGLQFNIQNHEALESIFEALDTDRSGELSYTEFKNGCDSLGFDLSDKECKVVFQKFDSSGDASIASIEYKEFVDYLYGNQNKKLIRSMFLLAQAYHKYRYISSYLTDINNPNPVKFKELLSKENIETSKDNVSRLLFLFNYSSETFIETFKDFGRLRQVGDLVDTITQELADSISKVISDVFNDEDCMMFWQKICLACDDLIGNKSFAEINKREYPVTTFMIGFLKCLELSEDSVLKKYFIFNDDDDDENKNEYKNHINLVSEDGLGYCLFLLRLLFIKYGLATPTINYKDFRFILYNPIMNSIELRIRLRLKILISQLTNTEQFLVSAEYEMNNNNNNNNEDDDDIPNKSDLIHITLHDISTGETLETTVNQKVVNYIPPCGINKEHSNALINPQCCPVESEALESLISCLEIRVNPETGKNSLVLKECERFINEIQSYFESSNVPFDFFMNITQSEIKFIRELDESGTRGLRHNILESIRKNKQLTLQLCNMNRRLDVIFESTGEESIYRETISWADFVDYLVGNRNPTYFITVEPDLENIYPTYYGPILEDGGSSINVDKTYTIAYESDKSNKKSLYNDCVTIGNKYYIVSLINTNNKREIVVYDSQIASPVKVVKDVHVEELPQDIDSDDFQKIWNSKINMLELGDSLSPYIHVSFNNGKNHIGVCKISIDSIISNDGCDLNEWYTIYNGDNKCGSVLIESTFLSKDRMEEVVVDYEKENEKYQNKLQKYTSKKEIPKSISDIDAGVVPKRLSMARSQLQQQQQQQEEEMSRSRKPSVRKSRTQTPNRSRRNSSTRTPSKISKTPRTSISPNKPQPQIEEIQQQPQPQTPIQQQQQQQLNEEKNEKKKPKVNELVSNRDVALLLSELKRSKDCFDISLKEKKLNSVISKLIIMLNPTNPQSLEKVKMTPTVVTRKHKVTGAGSTAPPPPSSSSGDMSLPEAKKTRKSLKPSTTKTSTLKSTPATRKSLGTSVSSGKKKVGLKKKSPTK